MPRVRARARRRGWLTALAVVLAASTITTTAVLLRPGARVITGSPLVAATAPGAATPSPPADFESLFARLSPGVVQVVGVTCSATGAGSGFLVGSRTVVTAAHVVENAAAVSVVSDIGIREATVTGIDPEADLAVLTLDEDLPGPVLRFAAGDPEPGTAVAAIGFPLGNPVTITQGTVSGLNRSVVVETGHELRGLLQTDAPVNPGNSGGPLVESDGDVVGVVVAVNTAAQGVGYAVQASVAAPEIADPAALAAPAPVTCQDPLLGPRGEATVGLPGEELAGSEVGTTLDLYFGGINTGDYETAFAQLSPRMQGGSSAEAFAAGVSTSYDFDFVVRDADLAAERPWVWLEFASLQDPAYGPSPGEGCTLWSLTYEFAADHVDGYLIDRVTPTDGGSGHQPCT